MRNAGMAGRGKIGAGGAALPPSLVLMLAIMVILGSGAPAGAQNLAQNAHFHTDVAGWDRLRGGALLWTDLADEGDCPGSGSALVTSEPVSAQHIAAISQCISVVGPTELFFSVRHMGYGTFRVELEYFQGTECYSSLTATIASESQTPTAWKEFAFPSWAPPYTVTMEIRLYATDSAPHGLSVDEVTLSRRPPIFLDGFEGSDGIGGAASPPCRW